MGQGQSVDAGGLYGGVLYRYVHLLCFSFLVQFVKNNLPLLGKACLVKSEETTLECVVTSKVRLSKLLL